MDRYPTTSLDAPAGRAFRRLSPLGRLALDAEACIAGRIPDAPCRRCIDACPHTSLALAAAKLDFDASRCTSCGQCAAACPTGALALDTHADGPAHRPQTPVLCCERSRSWQGAAARVPCLGAFALDDWLRRILAADGAPLRIVDDGSCATCANARNARPPWADAVVRTQRLLQALGAPANVLSVVSPEALLPNGNCSEAGPVLASRRRFFGGLTRTATSALSPASRAPNSPDRPLRTRGQAARPRGVATRTLLTQLALRYRSPQPPSAWLPAVIGSTACDLQGVCAGVCPTGALEIGESADGQHAELRFDAWRCIECGACAQHCPTGALRLEPGTWRAFATAPAMLASHTQCACTRCGASFTPRDAENLCGQCRKTETLARAGFLLFSRPPQASPARPAGP